MEKIYQGKSGKIYTTIGSPLASGGEGSIYAIKENSELVIKIFKESRRTLEKEKKLDFMLQYRLTKEQLKQVSWPQDIIYKNDCFVGYVMERLSENKNLNVVYSMSQQNLDLRHRMVIAYNLCAALDTVHSMNQVCGDLNPQNICVNLDLEAKDALRITLVDTDSYHVVNNKKKVYRCEVGMTNYLAPELQCKLKGERNLKTMELPTYTKNTDLFALAVHIFMLLMNGCHPFSCAKEKTEMVEDKQQEYSVEVPQPLDNIKNGFFPFYEKKDGITFPLYALDFSSLPQEIADLFVRSFVEGYKQPSKRVKAEEWMKVLKKFQSSSAFNRCEEKHYYFKGFDKVCPFCKMTERMQEHFGMEKKFGDYPNKKVQRRFPIHRNRKGKYKIRVYRGPVNQEKNEYEEEYGNENIVLKLLFIILIIFILFLSAGPV